MSEGQKAERQGAKQSPKAAHIPTGNWQEEQIRILAWPPSENPNPVLRFSPDGKILSANPPGDQLLRSLSEEKLKGFFRRAKRLRENLQKYGGLAWPWPTSDLSKPGP